MRAHYRRSFGANLEFSSIVTAKVLGTFLKFNLMLHRTMMFRYILLMVLIGFAFSDARNIKRQRQREYFKSVPDYDDYEDYDYPTSNIYGKQSESTNNRPSIFSYWNNLLKRTRLPRLNITNPFTRLFTPYVVKVDFPPGTDPGSQPNRNTNKRKDDQQYIYLNSYPNNGDPENAQYFYDPVTQQYYEVQQTTSEDYNPQNNYYATTFNDDDEIVINLGNKEEGTEQAAADVVEYEQRYTGKVKKVGLMGKYNSPALRTLKTKRFSIERKTASPENRRSLKRTKNVARLALV